MTTRLEVLFTPAEFTALATRDLRQTICVVFDIFRATSTIVTALANGATSVIPAGEISDALTIRRQRPDVLLAGEREGQRIRGDLSGGVDFDLGNSPREFIPAKIKNKTIVLSTTNGSRALRACVHARAVLVGSFLNLRATGDALAQYPDAKILFVCSGTGEQASYEDILGAGALVELLGKQIEPEAVADSANAALQIYQLNAGNLADAVKYCRNGRRLLTMSDLREDVSYCLQRDVWPLVAQLKEDAIVEVG